MHGKWMIDPPSETILYYVCTCRPFLASQLGYNYVFSDVSSYFLFIVGGAFPVLMSF